MAVQLQKLYSDSKCFKIGAGPFLLWSKHSAWPVLGTVLEKGRVCRVLTDTGTTEHRYDVVSMDLEDLRREADRREEYIDALKPLLAIKTRHLKAEKVEPDDWGFVE